MWHSKFVVKANESPVLKIHAKSNWKKFYPDLLLNIENDQKTNDYKLLIAISVYLINNRLKSAAAGASIIAVS